MTEEGNLCAQIETCEKDKYYKENIDFTRVFFGTIFSALCILQAAVTTRCNILSRQKMVTKLLKAPTFL